MKRLIVIIFFIFTLLSFNPAQAALEKVGTDLFYDTDLDITWYNPNVGEMNWYQTNNWITSLNEFHFGGVAGWRLPITPPIITIPLTYEYGYDITSSELGYLYHITLGNTADRANVLPLHTGFFDNLWSVNYWSSTIDPKYFGNPGKAFAFDFSSGRQGAALMDQYISYSALAVYDGKISAIPEPGILVLLGTGLAWLVVARRNMKG